MGITAISRDQGVDPSIVRITTTDSLATITTAQYLTTQQANIRAIQFGDFQWLSNDLVAIAYSGGENYFTRDATNNTFVLDVTPPGALALTNGHVFVGNSSNLAADVAMSGDVSITNTGATAVNSVQAGAVGGAGLASTLTTTSGITATFSTASATPGTIRAWRGLATETNTTMTTGNIVGVRGEVDMVGASGGFAYGVQGKVIPTGTLSGSVWAPAVFGQYDLSSATINAGQIAAIWGDMGASGGTFTNVTGARMFAGTNTIATLTLHSMIYLDGQATNLFELSGNNNTYISSGGSGVQSGTIKKIALTIDGTTYYLVASTVVT